MKYSQQQLKDLSRSYDTINLSVYLTNLRSQAIQSVLIDKQIPENLLDARNTNDIENDTIARRKEFYKYASKLFNYNDGETNQLKIKLNNDGLEYFFLNNYPKILQESKGFRKNTNETIYKITKRLYYREQEDMSIPNKNLKIDANWRTVLTYLFMIINTLKNLKLMALSPESLITVDDRLNRVETLSSVISEVIDPEQYIIDVTGMNSSEFVKYITKVNDTQWYDEKNSESWQSYISNLDPLFSKIQSDQLQNALSSQGSEEEYTGDQSEWDNLIQTLRDYKDVVEEASSNVVDFVSMEKLMYLDVIEKLETLLDFCDQYGENFITALYLKTPNTLQDDIIDTLQSIKNNTQYDISEEYKYLWDTFIGLKPILLDQINSDDITDAIHSIQEDDEQPQDIEETQNVPVMDIPEDTSGGEEESKDDLADNPAPEDIPVDDSQSQPPPPPQSIPRMDINLLNDLNQQKPNKPPPPPPPPTQPPAPPKPKLNFLDDIQNKQGNLKTTTPVDTQPKQKSFLEEIQEKQKKKNSGLSIDEQIQQKKQQQPISIQNELQQRLGKRNSVMAKEDEEDDENETERIKQESLKYKKEEAERKAKEDARNADLKARFKSDKEDKSMSDLDQQNLRKYQIQQKAKSGNFLDDIKNAKLKKSDSLPDIKPSADTKESKSIELSQSLDRMKSNPAFKRLEQKNNDDDDDDWLDGAGFKNSKHYKRVIQMKFPELKALVSKLKLPNPRGCKKKDLQKTLLKYYDSK